MSDDRSGFASGLLLGLLVGAAGAHYLNNTEKGQELLANWKEKAGDALKDLGDNPDWADKLAELEKTMNVAKEVVNAAAEKVASATEPAKPVKKNFFQRMGTKLGK